MPRTKSASAHRKVLDAALELIGEHGVEATSMDAIAGRSGVSKATIYKHWADKDALLLELTGLLAGLNSRPAVNTADTRAGMIAVLAYRPPEDTQARERTMPHLGAYAARNQAFGIAWRKMVMEPPRRELTQLIEQGVAKRELSASLDTNLALALLLGPMIYWKALANKCEQDDQRALADQVVDAFWRAFGKSRNDDPPRTRSAAPSARRLRRS